MVVRAHGLRPNIAKALLVTTHFATRVMVMNPLPTLFGCETKSASNHDTPQQSGGYETAEPYSKLRTQLLQLRVGDVGLPSKGVVEPVAILMETIYPEAMATLISAANGTTNMYFSNGSNVIGASEHVSG